TRSTRSNLTFYIRQLPYSPPASAGADNLCPGPSRGELGPFLVFEGKETTLSSSAGGRCSSRSLRIHPGSRLFSSGILRFAARKAVSAGCQKWENGSPAFGRTTPCGHGRQYKKPRLFSAVH